MTSPTAPGLAWLNGADERAAREALRRVCASRAWVEALLAGRPHPDRDALFAANDRAVAGLSAVDLAEALAGHPPIGRPKPGDPDSAREQRGMAEASDQLRAEMVELNLAYQERFGHVFLICATGLDAERMRAALRARLHNPPETEAEIARAELGKINAVRLRRLAEATTTVSTHVLDTAAGRPAAGVPVQLAVRAAPDGAWAVHAAATTDADGRCAALPPLPGGARQARLTFAVAAHREPDPAFFPEVATVFAVEPGQHYHVPLLLSPFGYSVYRGS
ncbi:2-oxo-4-hydroxy-4-carboxy-5-ureidoimidazoline decarboxylase [Streptomyces sp. 8K308]|uniref:2-oxo-4-hydroxy-4-carboxy-5-ureidoimidazoline decarboxylase n=1 Tax=Streptomyces sp. 8K308 TaxID=2530388 RepID=UPI00104F6FDD|nr:2-oxo-4-hydroxy-4-carboxy-5-ureidoimidazoline decarboxylase [Streptomyces sp. 8K308]TDC19244.1 2-oxo-4-hydroxy-4-carboxy-5-ureidoimidazoline decarboxylase [Streptomyces sp. 8K308]